LAASAWLRELSTFSVTKASQLRTKSDQWHADARFLHDSRRYAASVYLGGFVIELMLKAALWPRRREPRIASLLHRSHDLRQLVEECQAIWAEIQKPPHARVLQSLEFLASWSVRIRYNPKQPSADDSADYRRRVELVRTWLRGKT
jgi:hypothetical protein